MSDECERCGSERQLETHHTQYLPEKTVKVCRACHNAIHNNPDSPLYPDKEIQDLFRSPKQLDGIPNNATPTIKHINDNSYFYWNWRDGQSIKSKYICSVSGAPSHQHCLAEADE
jgi:hypothetical protein